MPNKLILETNGLQVGTNQLVAQAGSITIGQDLLVGGGIKTATTGNALSFSTSNGEQLRVLNLQNNTTSVNRYLEISGGVSGLSAPGIGTGGGQEVLDIYSSGNSIWFSTGGGKRVAGQAEVRPGGDGTNYLSFTGGTNGNPVQINALGSNANISIVLAPKGTGALQAQLSDGTATGGNARGANAVDWSMFRTGAGQVASGLVATLGGGQQNTVSGAYATVAGGRQNNVGNNDSVIAGGNGNLIAASLTKAGAILGGTSNTANGFYNVIGGGFTNSGTSNTAVTTQTTTIDTTAGTTLYLSSANANIRVGAYVAGTGVSSETYATSTVTTGTPAVMNTSTISGTTLTVGSLASGTIIAGQVLTGTGVTAGTYIVSGSGLSWVVSVSQTVASTTITGTARTITISQNATTAAGVTLSFYTPHGVVVGGGNNQATGSYSFIGGGGNAGTSAERNSAQGDWSIVVGGKGCSSVADYGMILGGQSNNISSGATWASIIGGANCTVGTNSSSSIAGGNGCSVGANASNATAIGGRQNTATATASSVFGGNRGTTRGISGNTVFPAAFIPIADVLGITQAALLILARETTTATPTVLTSDSSAAGTTNQVILPNNSAYFFRGEVIAGVTGGGDTKGWTIEGVIKRGANAASTAFVGTPTVTSSFADAGASTWTIAVTVDGTNGGLRVTFTGQASTTIRCVAQIRTTEMTF